MLRIDCAHCGNPFKKWPNSQHSLGSDARGFWIISAYGCPFCERYTITHQCADLDSVEWIKRDAETFIVAPSNKILYSEIAYPKHPMRRVATEVPETLKAEFAEADAVLTPSPRSSVVISRRILQLIFHSYLQIKKGDLSEEIEVFISESRPPSYLAKVLHRLLGFGNKAAGEGIEISPGEAEFTLAVVELMFDFVFVQPARAEAMAKRLNARLEAAGKDLSNSE